MPTAVSTCNSSDSVFSHVRIQTEMRCTLALLLQLSRGFFYLFFFLENKSKKNYSSVQRSSEDSWLPHVIRSLFLNHEDVTTQLVLGMSDCVFLSDPAFPSKGIYSKARGSGHVISLPVSNQKHAAAGRWLPHKGTPSLSEQDSRVPETE